MGPIRIPLENLVDWSLSDGTLSIATRENKISVRMAEKSFNPAPLESHLSNNYHAPFDQGFKVRP